MHKGTEASEGVYPDELGSIGGRRGREMNFRVEAWIIPYENDEEESKREMVYSKEFTNRYEAMRQAWEWLEFGFNIRMWRR
jgi:hypothetical protein